MLYHQIQQRIIPRDVCGTQDAWEQKVQGEKLPDGVAQALKIERKKRTAEQAKAVTDHYLGTFPEHQALKKQVEGAKKSLDNLKKSVLITMIM